MGKGAEVQVVNFTSICTSFTYQDKKKYAKIYRERILRENAWNTRKYKENRGYTKLCKIKLKCSLSATAETVFLSEMPENQGFVGSGK